jgi:hypothetical protein
MPPMMVWPVSSSVRTVKVGSSSDSFCRDSPSFCWSAFVFGSMAMWMTGLGKSIVSSSTGWSASQSVSPVVVCLRPTAAAMSPVKAASLSSRVLACIWRMRPNRSFLSFVELTSASPWSM